MVCLLLKLMEQKVGLMQVMVVKEQKCQEIFHLLLEIHFKY